MKLKGVLIGGQEAWKAADDLKKNNISVIYTNIYNLPVRDDDAYDRYLRARRAQIDLLMEAFPERKRLGALLSVQMPQVVLTGADLTIGTIPTARIALPKIGRENSSSFATNR